MLPWQTRCAILAFCAIALATPSAAQTVRGVVRDSLGGEAVPGAVVQLLSADGDLVARGVTNARGEYLLSARRPVSQLRAVRIGYRPRTLPLTSGEATDIRVDIRMLRFQAYLDPVRVIAAQCRRRGRQSPAGLIEQARAGLLTTIVSRESNPAAMRRLYFERAFSPTTDSVERMLVHLDSAERETRSFGTARDAAEFVELGFFDASSGRFFGPDAEVLLDDRFAAGYCFRVMPASRARPHQIGLGFEPATSKRGRVDIEGALWLDTLKRELRDLEFRYVGLDGTLTRYGPGGSIVFRQVENGTVVLDNWALYLIGTSRDTISGSRPGRAPPPMQVFRWQTGGQLLEAKWNDGTSWRAQLGVVRGTAQNTDGVAAAGVTFLLAGTPYTAIADSTGAFTFRDVLPGPYRVHAVDPQLATLGISLPTAAAVSATMDTTTIRVAVPSVRSLAREVCPSDARDGEDAHGVYVLSRAITEDGRPVADAGWALRAHLTAEWSELAGQGRTDANGLLAVCTRLQRGYPVDLKVVVPGNDTTRASRVVTDGVNIIPIVVPPPVVRP